MDPKSLLKWASPPQNVSSCEVSFRLETSWLGQEENLGGKIHISTQLWLRMVGFHKSRRYSMKRAL